MRANRGVGWLLVAAGLLAGCASISNTMESWVGHHQSDLIASWGPPQQIMDDGQGGRIFAYTTTRSYTSPGSATTTINDLGMGATAETTYRPPVTSTYNAYRMFWLDREGRIYKWAWKGL